MMNNMNDNELNRVVRVHQAIKKEEEEQEHDNDDEENKKTTQSITPKSIHGIYDDWKNGNWCWLLPATRNANGKTRQKRKSSDNCTKPTHSVKSEDGDDTKNNNDSATPEIKIAATTSTAEKKLSDGDGDGDDDNDNDDDDDNDNDDESNKPSPPKKKMRRCRLPINDIVNKENEEGEKEDCVYATYDEANNNTTNDNKDDDDDDDDEEKGYESWTEGNWCLLLPFSSTVVDNIETTRPAATYTGRRRAAVRSCNSSPDDGNDDVSSAKSNTRKITTTYNTWRNERWDEMFQRLVAYKKVNKSTTVTRNYKEDPELGNWVHHQRVANSSKLISAERTRRLDSIGFVWKIREPHEQFPWMDIYLTLVAYKKKHKSTNVPRYGAYPRLGKWVSKQRQFYNNKTLSIERINRLELIGFVWDPYDAQWMEMYGKLVEYKKENNSTKVPRLYTKYPSLGLWVSTQRKAYNNGKMTGKRLELLNSINFAWS
jgi:hypothetical protein